MAEVLPFMLHLFLMVPLPLTVTMLLLFELLNMDVCAMFAFEEAESDLMHRFPRMKKYDHIASTKMLY